MGPAKTTVRTISQEAFNDLVKENIDDLEMEPVEAVQDAIQTLTLQGVDLSGIVTSVPGESNPVIECIEKLRQLDSETEALDENEMVEVFDKLVKLGGAENANQAIATKNGGVQLVCSLCSKIVTRPTGGSHTALLSALNAMQWLLQDVQSRGAFHNSNGPRIIVDILNDNKQNIYILNIGFLVVASAATRDEIVKESFMELKVDELMLEIISMHKNARIQSLYAAIQALLTPDDNRVVASQVYGYARKFAKIGITEAIVDSLRTGLASPNLVSACSTLKAIAVNSDDLGGNFLKELFKASFRKKLVDNASGLDILMGKTGSVEEICKSIADNGGIDVVLRCIDDSGEQGNRSVAAVCCSLLSKLAGSDANKSTIAGKGGMDKLIKLSARFADGPVVLQEIMYIISVLSLRSPENAARAIEAGAGDLAIQAMQKFPEAPQLQRNSCLMIRNLAVRNPENRTILLNSGIEKYIRKAKQTHTSCKEAATDALRDLGVDNYNL